MEHQQNYLLGNFELCLSSMKRLLGSNPTNRSIVNNIALSEWVLSQNIDKLRTSLQDLMVQKDFHNIDQESLIISFNLAVTYFIAGESEKARDHLFPLLNTLTIETNTPLLFRFADLLSDILFSMLTSFDSSVAPFPSEWNSVMSSLASSIKEFDATPSAVAARNYLTFRVHLLNCRYYIRSNQFKAAKKESKLAMELYNHQIKTISHPMFAQVLAQFHGNLPGIANELSSNIDINREIMKEGCLVHSLKVIKSPSLHSLTVVIGAT
jgi:hypothetical protein